jgi:LmbE family N-acetylglucosaminyl deacetylase
MAAWAAAGRRVAVAVATTGNFEDWAPLSARRLFARMLENAYPLRIWTEDSVTVRVTHPMNPPRWA